MPSPDNQHHKSLEKRVVEYLYGSGYVTAKAGYHDVYPPEITQILQRAYSPTALNIRTRADQIAIHKETLMTFRFDAKTHENKKYQDMTIELYPLLFNIQNAYMFGTLFLYCYYNPFTGNEYGFWCSDIPKIREVHFPQGQNRYGDIGWLRLATDEILGDVTIREVQTGGGSGDPYAIFDKSELRKLNHWTHEIDQLQVEQQMEINWIG